MVMARFLLTVPLLSVSLGPNVTDFVTMRKSPGFCALVYSVAGLDDAVSTVIGMVMDDSGCG